jgi:5-methylcytosine-specific restriction protein A
VRRATEKALDGHGRLACAACGFDFATVYGDVGRGFIECHHLLALADLADEHKTRLADVALVCPACHRMVHRRRPWLGLDKLAELLVGRRPPGTGESSSLTR